MAWGRGRQEGEEVRIREAALATAGLEGILKGRMRRGGGGEEEDEVGRGRGGGSTLLQK